MQRRALLILAVILIILVAALPVAWEMRWSSPPARLVVPPQAADDPLVNEMECIDRILQDDALKPEQVNASLAMCR